MRYQVAALVTAVITVVALAGVAAFVWRTAGEDGEAHRHAAAEAEIAAVDAALRTRIDGLQRYAATLLQEQAVIDYARAAGRGPAPAVLEAGPVARGGADYLLLSGPNGEVITEDGLTGSVVESVGGDAGFLLDGALEGGILDIADGPVLAAGASTGAGPNPGPNPGTERVAVTLGVLLDQATLSSMVPDTSRQLTLAWAGEDAPPPGVQVIPGASEDRVSIVSLLDLGRGERDLVAVVDAPASVLPDAAGASLGRWAALLAAIGLAGAAGLGLIVRRMATSLGELRRGLATAQEHEGSPAALDALAGRDEIGLTARQAADTLRAQRERLITAADEAHRATARQRLGEHIIRSMHEGVLVERADTTCIVCNPAAANFVGVEPEDIVGLRGALESVLGADLYRRMRERAANPDAAERLDVEALDGRNLAFDAYQVPEYGGGEGRALLVIFRDLAEVTEATEAAEITEATEPTEPTEPTEVAEVAEVAEVEEVEEFGSDLISVVGEELRAPLTVVGLSLGMMGEPGADQQQLLRAAECNVQRMRDLVEDMIDLARLEDGRAELTLERHNPLQVCAEAIESLRPQAEERQVSLRDAVDGAIPQWIDVDAQQVQRAVTNLLSNAIKFSPSGGTVWVILRGGGDHLFIDVADAGPGVPPEERERIFTRFYRASNTRDRVAGAGLGLPIARRVAELHGGTAEILPAEQGSYFRITLPVGDHSSR